MPTFDKQKVDIAVSNHSKLDVSSTHITTGSWMELSPVYYRHMIPGETLKGQGNVLSRLAPVAVPTYGRCRINMRAFFVPFRTIFPNFNEFITDVVGSNFGDSSLIVSSPCFNSDVLFEAFRVGTFFNDEPLMVDVDSIDPYDYVSDGTYYRLTFFGRHCKKIVESLGYRLIPPSKGEPGINYSSLALLAYAKVYIDWYFNQAYVNSEEYLRINQLFKFNNPDDYLELTYSDIVSILNVVFAVFYDNGNDVYVNAWDNPIAPNSGNYSNLSGFDVTSGAANSGFSVVLDSNGTPYMKQNASTQTSVGTQYLHNFLKSATDYVKRNQLAGALQIDRFLARFGINLDSAKANRSIYVASQSVDVDFGSVMSNAATNDAPIGEYAGQGLGRGQLDFEFHTDEFGIFIVTSSIVPAASLYQGYDRNNLHVDKLQFFTPEFDNLGVQMITSGEVYVSNDSAFGEPLDYQDSSFGYAPRYYEYKQSRDFVTGDFVTTAMAGGDSWHLNRMFDDDYFDGLLANVHHSLEFTRGLADSGQYNRIFHYTEDDIDQFYLVYHFAVQANSPCKSLFDTYDFDSAGDTITMNGNNAKVN